jgi:hypothetical protein
MEKESKKLMKHDRKHMLLLQGELEPSSAQVCHGCKQPA